jgi:hypothetical protein
MKIPLVGPSRQVGCALQRQRQISGKNSLQRNAP